MKKVTVLVGPGRTKRPTATFGSAARSAAPSSARLLFFSSGPKLCGPASQDGPRPSYAPAVPSPEPGPQPGPGPGIRLPSGLNSVQKNHGRWITSDDPPLISGEQKTPGQLPLKNPSPILSSPLSVCAAHSACGGLGRDGLTPVAPFSLFSVLYLAETRGGAPLHSGRRTFSCFFSLEHAP